MTLEEYLKQRNEILQEETPAEANEPNYPVYESAPVSRVGLIGAQSYSGPTGGGFLPLIPIPQTPESEYTDEYTNAYEREYATAENMEPIRQKVQEAQAPVYEPIKERETQAPVYEPIKIQERAEAEYAAPQKQYERNESFSPLEERTKEAAPQQNEAEKRKEAEKFESVEILPEGNYPDAKTIEEFYREQGIYATDEGTGAGRYFDIAPQATGKGEENLLQRAFRAMTEYQKGKMENIGETLGTQIAASALAAPVIGSIASAMAPAAPVAIKATQPVLSQTQVGNIIADSFGKINNAGVKAATDNAFRQAISKGTAAASGSALAGRALVGAYAEKWDPGTQKVTTPAYNYGPTTPTKTAQSYDYGYGATDPSKFTQPTKTAQNYASYAAPATPIKVNVNYDSASGTNTKTKTSTAGSSVSGSSGIKYKTAY